MHILVVDDFVLVELALAQVVQGTPHTLTGVRDPRSLPEVLSQEGPFDLALVDINFGPGAPGQRGPTPVQRLVRNSGCLDELIRSRTDLMLWRALVRFDKRGEVVRAAHVDERTVDRFTASKSLVVDEIQAEFPEDATASQAPPREEGDPGGQRRHPNLVRLARFAQTHSHFFADEAIDELFAARWQAPRTRRRRSWR